MLRAHFSERFTLFEKAVAGRNRAEEGSAPPRRSDNYHSAGRIGDPGVELPLQRRSKRLNHRTVAAVLEEAAGVFGTESRDRSAHRFEKSFSATRLGFTHQAFDLAECLLDGVEVR